MGMSILNGGFLGDWFYFFPRVLLCACCFLVAKRSLQSKQCSAPFPSARELS